MTTDPLADAIEAALRNSPYGAWLTLPGATDLAPGFAWYAADVARAWWDAALVELAVEKATGGGDE